MIFPLNNKQTNNIDQMHRSYLRIEMRCRFVQNGYMNKLFAATLPPLTLHNLNQNIKKKKRLLVRQAKPNETT